MVDAQKLHCQQIPNILTNLFYFIWMLFLSIGSEIFVLQFNTFIIYCSFEIIENACVGIE